MRLRLKKNEMKKEKLVLWRWQLPWLYRRVQHIKRPRDKFQI